MRIPAIFSFQYDIRGLAIGDSLNAMKTMQMVLPWFYTDLRRNGFRSAVGNMVNFFSLIKKHDQCNSFWFLPFLLFAEWQVSGPNPTRTEIFDGVQPLLGREIVAEFLSLCIGSHLSPHPALPGAFTVYSAQNN